MIPTSEFVAYLLLVLSDFTDTELLVLLVGGGTKLLPLLVTCTVLGSGGDLGGSLVMIDWLS
jgi:hypothetical protein